jgi:hypothetical protein
MKGLAAVLWGGDRSYEGGAARRGPRPGYMIPRPLPPPLSGGRSRPPITSQAPPRSPSSGGGRRASAPRRVEALDAATPPDQRWRPRLGKVVLRASMPGATMRPWGCRKAPSKPGSRSPERKKRQPLIPAARDRPGRVAGHRASVARPAPGPRSPSPRPHPGLTEWPAAAPVRS